MPEFDYIIDTWKRLMARGEFKKFGQRQKINLLALDIPDKEKPRCYIKFAADLGLEQPCFRIGLS